MYKRQDQHPEPVGTLDWEVVTDPRPKSPGTWPDFARIYRRARDFRPDVVITEFVRDPRWLALGALAPRVNFRHDDQPHGVDEERPRWERAIFDRWGASARRTICFSDYVATRLGGVLSTQSIGVVPLSSDLPDNLAAHPETADRREDFVLIGRLNEYKNLPTVFEAWQRHVTGPGYQGDTLRLYGSAPTPPRLPKAAWWNGGPYDYHTVVAPLRRAKGSVAHYRLATQSGVQVLSMQLGVAPIVSTHGALPEFQPQIPAPIDRDDITGLTAAFDLLADPRAAAAAGEAAARRYRRDFAAPVAAAALRRELLLVAKEHHR